MLDGVTHWIRSPFIELGFASTVGVGNRRRSRRGTALGMSADGLRAPPVGGPVSGIPTGSRARPLPSDPAEGAMVAPPGTGWTT